MKLLFDDTMVDLSQARKAQASYGQAWETLRFRIAQNAAAFDHAVSMGSVLAAQAGVTESQQTVSPVRTATADNLASGAAPANRITDSTSAVAGGAIDSATAQATLNNVTMQLGELVTAVTGLSAVVAQIVQNAKQQASPAN